MFEDIISSVVGSGGIVTAVAMIGVAIIFGALFYQRVYKSPKTNEAIVITGMGSGKTIEVDEPNPEFVPEEIRVKGKKYLEKQLEPTRVKKIKFSRILYQSGGIVWPAPFQRMNRVPLGVTQIDLKRENLISGNRVPVGIEATVYVKVPAEESFIIAAAQNFREFSKEQISDLITKSLDGHIRGIVATKTPEEINENLQDINREVMRVAEPDMQKLGLSIDNFAINAIINETYFGNLAKIREVQVSRDAKIAEAVADKEARLQKAENEQKAVEREQKKEQEIAKYKRDAKVKQEEMRKEEQTATAEADLANQLKTAEVNEKVIEREQQVEIMKQEKQKVIEQKKADAEGTYMTEIAEYQAKKDITEAEGQFEAKKIEEQKLGEGEKLRDKERAEGIKALGEAEGAAERAKGEGEGAAIKAKKNAEAEGVKNLMEAYGKMGDRALQIEAIDKVVNVMPEIAKETAAGAARLGEKMTYVQLGNGDEKSAGVLSAENLAGIAGAVPALLKTHGLDLKKYLPQKALEESSEEEAKKGRETEGEKV